MSFALYRGTLRWRECRRYHHSGRTTLPQHSSRVRLGRQSSSTSPSSSSKSRLNICTRRSLARWHVISGCERRGHRRRQSLIRVQTSNTESDMNKSKAVAGRRACNEPGAACQQTLENSAPGPADHTRHQVASMGPPNRRMSTRRLLTRQRTVRIIRLVRLVAQNTS